MESANYMKPNMTGLPKELGTRIFRTILSTPAPDWDRMEREADELERKMIKERKKHGDWRK